jgi:hypothetical protein
MDNQTDPLHVVPVIAEELVITKQAVAAGSVRVRKEIGTVEETFDLQIVRDVISIDYITIDRPISEIPAMREEGDTLIHSRRCRRGCYSKTTGAKAGNPRPARSYNGKNFPFSDA